MKNNKGFTIVELIIVLSLLSMVLTGVLTFLGYSLGVFGDTKARTIVQDEVNSVLKTLANDIRSASKPDLKNKAIVVYKGAKKSNEGDRIDIYDYRDNKYQLISYKYENQRLYRGVKEAKTADDIIDSAVVYSIFLEGVKYPSEGELFEDITADAKSDRRTIRINLNVEDSEGKIRRPVTISATYTSRSKGMP